MANPSFETLLSFITLCHPFANDTSMERFLVTMMKAEVLMIIVTMTIIDDDDVDSEDDDKDDNGSLPI